MIRRIIQAQFSRVSRFLLGLQIGKNIDQDSYVFIVHNNKRFGKTKADEASAVVLVGIFDYPIMTYCYASVLNWLKRNKGISMRSYSFSSKCDPVVQLIYESFGVRQSLGRAQFEEFKRRSELQADSIFSQIKTKWDVFNIKDNGIRIGDLIYNSYLRYYSEVKVKTTDPRLRDLICEALLILNASLKYMQESKVAAFIADDYGYIHGGIPTRVAMSLDIPVFLVCFGKKFFIYQMFGEKETNWHDYPIRWPFHKYHKLFNEMPSEKQAAAASIGNAHVNSKLSGAIDKFTLETITAYGKSNERVLEANDKPKMLVLMHDFFDSPHAYRTMLFPDFYDWIHFLLSEAEKTDFEWYIKPHPCVWDEKTGMINAQNSGIIDELKSRYPSAKWIKPQTSNRQLVDDGISAIFTVYGTAGHEFAYFGIPVVNAGDNPHIAYSFNFHPSTIEEYSCLIATADKLKIDVRKEEIDEYCYMNYFYFPDKYSTRANPVGDKFYSLPNANELFSKRSSYSLFMKEESADRDQCLNDYYKEVFSKVNLG